jgi:hypothetical protein
VSVSDDADGGTVDLPFRVHLPAAPVTVSVALYDRLGDVHGIGSFAVAGTSDPPPDPVPPKG